MKFIGMKVGLSNCKEKSEEENKAKTSVRFSGQINACNLAKWCKYS